MSPMRFALVLAGLLCRGGVILCCGIAGLACSQHVQVRTEPGPAELWLAGERVDNTGSGQVEVEIPPGIDDVPFEIREGENIRRGLISRSEPDIPWVVTAVVATACCVPSLAATGFCVSNPAMWLAIVGGCASVNPSLCLSVASFSPTWWSLPVASGGALCGTTPLWANLWASRVPAVVDLRPPDAPAPAPKPESPKAKGAEPIEKSSVSSEAAAGRVQALPAALVTAAGPAEGMAW